MPKIRYCRGHVEGPLGVGRHRQEAAGEEEREDAERDVDGEQDRPARDGEQSGTEAGAGRQRGRHDGGIEAQPAAERGAWIDRTHQGGLYRHDGRTAQPLQRARRDQPREGGRKHAPDRGQREDHEAPAIDGAIAHDVAQRRDRQQHDHQGDLVGVDDPDRALRRDREILRDVGQGQIGHRIAEHRHRQADGDGCHGGESPWPRRHAVGERAG